MTVETIMAMVTAIVTYGFGMITKKYELLESEYIPLQNLLVGIFSGILIYAVGLNDNIIQSIVIGLISSMSAGGIYDLSQTKGGVK